MNPYCPVCKKRIAMPWAAVATCAECGVQFASDVSEHLAPKFIGKEAGIFGRNCDGGGNPAHTPTPPDPRDARIKELEDALEKMTYNHASAKALYAVADKMLGEALAKVRALEARHDPA